MRIVRSFEYPGERVQAAVKIFGRIMDDHRPVVKVLNTMERKRFGETMGTLRYFSARNPTGRYLLSLAISSQHRIASWMLEQYKLQKEEGHCSWPLKVRLPAGIMAW